MEETKCNIMSLRVRIDEDSFLQKLNECSIKIREAEQAITSLRHYISIENGADETAPPEE